MYCDRLLVGPPIERKRPVIATWLSSDLEKRQKEEVDSGNSGDLLLEWRETPEGQEYLKTMLAEHSHRDVHFDSCGCRDDGGEEQTEQEAVKV